MRLWQTGKGVSLPLGISSDERKVLESGQSSSAGVATVVVATGRSTLSAATAVAALTCEALQAQVRACPTPSPDMWESPGTRRTLLGEAWAAAWILAIEHALA
jgi:histidine ammonia-lyase